MISFDTLKLTSLLEGVGFTVDQAAKVAEALADRLFTNFVSKADLQQVETELKAELAGLRAATRKWIISAAIFNLLVFVVAFGVLYSGLITSRA